MCKYKRIDDPQRFSKEELSAEEIEHRIRNIIKVGRDEPLKLKIPIYKNSSCPEVSISLFCHDHLFSLNNFASFCSFLPFRLPS
jgi:hypothetical protein